MAKAKKRSAESFAYVLEKDRELPPDQQTRFMLRPLTTGERHSLFERATERIEVPGGVRVISHTLSIAREVCRDHIESIDRFPSDKPVPWPQKTKERDEYLDQFDDLDLVEIYNELFRRSWVGDEEKNSSTPGPTSSSGAP
jgi:hypothetical protein